MTGIVCALPGVIKPAAAVRTAKTITAFGNAQVDTAQSKFGGASCLLDGTGDRLQVDSNADFAFGTGNFTIEMFIRYSTTSVGQHFYLDGRSSTDGNVAKPTFYYASGEIRYWLDGGDKINSAWTPSANTWYHLAISRSSNSTKLFIDGTQYGSTYTDNYSYVAFSSAIGDYVSGGYGFPGWIDEIRISNSARYTANFTAPSAAFVNDSNTVLLVHCNGADASTTFTDDTG